MNDPVLPACITTRPDGISLAVRVHPRASANAVGGVHNGELKVRVTAPPVDAAANEAVVRLLADALGCPKSAIEIARGHASRRKVLVVRGVTAAAAARAIARAAMPRRAGA
ncbi:MAG TPA: DUF167 domain-containing protein [Gemmatimonadaceae bacterium]|nr:DUF167 domain-containing protein [Gemmatimonadaceae bacterium]